MSRRRFLDCNTFLNETGNGIFVQFSRGLPFNSKLLEAMAVSESLQPSAIIDDEC